MKVKITVEAPIPYTRENVEIEDWLDPACPELAPVLIKHMVEKVGRIVCSQMQEKGIELDSVASQVRS